MQDTFLILCVNIRFYEYFGINLEKSVLVNDIIFLKMTFK